MPMNIIEAKPQGGPSRKLVRLNLLLPFVLALVSACSSYSGLASPPPQPAGPNDVVGFRLLNTGDAMKSPRIVTFGQVFAAGDVPAGTDLVALIDGHEVALQVDVKATHPDGSIRHAILSLAAPALGADGSADVMLARGTAPAQPAVDIADILDHGYDVALTVDGRTIQVADVLARALADGSAETWMSGPLATEVRVGAPVSADGNLHAYFDIRAYADGTVHTDVVMAYDGTYAMGMDNLTYDVAITEGGRTVARYDDLEHNHHATWHQEVWSGGADPDLHVIRDVPYLIQTGAVPALDSSIPISDAALADLAADLANADTGPMGSALVQTAMPGTGGRPDIGVTTKWGALYLLSQDPRAEAALLANADAAGSIPWHFRDEATGEYVRIDDHPDLWIDGRGTGPNYADADELPEAYTTSNTDWKVDTAHQPQLSYLPYLFTGSHYYLDELLAQASWTVASTLPPSWRGYEEGIFDSSAQVRAKAWTLRTLGDAAYITPDDNALKDYFETLLDNNLQHYVQKYVIDGHLDAAGAVEGWMWGTNPSGQTPPWQTDFFAATRNYLAQRGYDQAETMLDWLGNFVAGRFIHGADGFDPMQGVAYRLQVINPETGALYNTWQEVYEASFPEPPDGSILHAGYPYSYAAVAKGALASLISGTGSAEAIEAYGFVVGEATRFWDKYAEDPKWNFAPRLADGQYLLHSDIHLGSGTMTGSARDELLHGDTGADALRGGGGIDLLFGDAGDDQIAGEAGDDYLFGGAGADRLAGGAGSDHLKGNAGADLFVFAAAEAGHDVVLDFELGVDRLALAGGDPTALLAGATEDADGNAVLHLAPDTTITLLGINQHELSHSSIIAA
jgi:hypothetical protein